MNVELGFNIGNRYSIALLRKVGAANWLAFLCMSWGIVVFGAGFAKKWEDIVVCRLLLGMFEAGFFPGCMFKPEKFS
jgi:hypothetical protein